MFVRDAIDINANIDCVLNVIAAKLWIGLPQIEEVKEVKEDVVRID